MIVKCENCKNKYEVGGCHLNRVKMILDFAICPLCGAKRFPQRFEGWKDEDLCVRCHVPRKLVPYDGARRLCGACYHEFRRKGAGRENYPLQMATR